MRDLRVFQSSPNGLVINFLDLFYGGRLSNPQISSCECSPVLYIILSNDAITP